MKGLEKLHDKKYKFVFFDIFDTIVKRSVFPENTKRIWANHLAKSLDSDITMIEIYEARQKIEYNLGYKNNKSGHDFEFTYKDLIKELYKMFDFKISQKSFMELSTKIEVSAESAVQIVDEEVITEIKKLKKEGKKIYCVSDMYLSKEMIKQIFTNHGIDNYFDDFFISCEYLKNKKSGALYEVVMKNIKAKAEECIMVGDNKYSDYESPKTKKIEAIHLNREKNHQEYQKMQESSFEFEKTIYNKLEELSSTSTNNFEHLVFSLYIFIEKLYFNLVREGRKEVFFLSREGEFLKKLFDEYVKNIHGEKIKSYYLLVSRKATYLPSLKSLEKENFDYLLNQYSYTSIEELLKSLNFSKEDLKKIEESSTDENRKIIKQLELNKDEENSLKHIVNTDLKERVYSLNKSCILRRLKNNETFKNLYEKNRVEQNTLFKKYIKQFTDNSDICLVDVGWNGSIQDNITNILGDSYKVSGYLVGYVSRVPKPNKSKKGLLFSNVPEESLNYNLFNESRSLYEVLLGASHGSANRYYEEDGVVKVALFNKKEEQDIYINVVSKIQDRMFKLFKQLLDVLEDNYYDENKVEKRINQIHYKMIFCPNKEQLNFFSKIYHYENFGVFEFTEFKSNKKMTWKYYIKENAKYYLRHRNFFYDSWYWPLQKLYTEKLFVPRFTYKLGKKMDLKRKGVI